MPAAPRPRRASATEAARPTTTHFSVRCSPSSAGSGLLAFLRGVFVLRAAADGQAGASAGRAAMHMLGGVCAWHAESLIGAVQTSLGIQVLRIT